MKKSLFVTLANIDYIEHAKQLFASAYLNGAWDGDFMLLAHSIPNDEISWFTERGILVKECELIIEQGWGLQIQTEWPPLIAHKFYLFKEEFKTWEIIIYMDADILIQVPINLLKDVKTFAAVTDVPYKRRANRLYSQLSSESCNKNFSEEFNTNKKAFNAGVIVINTQIITSDLFDRLVTNLKLNFNCYLFGEQTALNFVFYNNWEKLPLFYNSCINYLPNVNPKKIENSVLHFAYRKNYPRLWQEENPFYENYVSNLIKSENINFRKNQSNNRLNKNQERWIEFRYRMLLFPKYLANEIIVLFKNLYLAPKHIREKKEKWLIKHKL